MKTLKLSLREEPEVESELALTPHDVAGRQLEEVTEIPVQHGNQERRLVYFFEVSGETADEPGDQELVIEGDCSKFKSIGREMDGGRIVVRGDAGLYAGAEMRDGDLVVEGDVLDWCGAEKGGGKIVVEGDAGSYLGGSFRGSRRGMDGGSIRVDGSVGTECGSWLAGGSIRVKGDAGDMLGIHMAGGDIHVEGDAGRFTGGAMTGGRILVDGSVGPMPTFSEVEDEDVGGTVYRRFKGDEADGGEGELLTPA